MGHLGSTWSSSAPGEHPRRFAWSSTGTDRSIQIVPPSWGCAQGRRQAGENSSCSDRNVCGVRCIPVHCCPSTFREFYVCSVQGERVTPDKSYLEDFLSALFASRILEVGKLFATAQKVQQNSIIPKFSPLIVSGPLIVTTCFLPPHTIYTHPHYRVHLL